ncbi:MAG: cupin domain-containing protein [Deltaproteobacteria bacterium]|nr:cupin domain-containing protein [Deltaproteobacteria bacterium]
MSNKKEAEAEGMSQSKPIILGELVNYQSNSIVSRTLVNKNGGTLTLFAFDKGQSLSEHSAPFDAVVQILDGEAELIIGGGKVLASAGHTVLMPAGVPHAINAPKCFKMLLIMIREVTA